MRESRHPRAREDDEEEVSQDIYMFVSYAGKEAESVILRCKKRLFKLFKTDLNIKFHVHLQSKKLCFFT